MDFVHSRLEIKHSICPSKKLFIPFKALPPS
jgi:hypothetical protein